MPDDQPTCDQCGGECQQRRLPSAIVQALVLLGLGVLTMLYVNWIVGLPLVVVGVFFATRFEVAWVCAHCKRKVPKRG